jgi:hypothetical protein
MVIFNSYVKLPEGILLILTNPFLIFYPSRISWVVPSLDPGKNQPVAIPGLMLPAFRQS